MGKLNGKIALVTGSTSGIGAACAKAYAQEGARVIVTGRNEERGTAVAAEIRQAGGEAVFIRADLKSEEEIRRLIAEGAKVYGGIDSLVNNAAVYFVKGLEDISVQQWDELYQTNVRAIFVCVQEALPYLKKSAAPSILNIASAAGLMTNLGDYAYGSSKAAVIHLTEIMARNFGADGIRVNAICPGVIQTPIFGGRDMTDLGPRMPLGRIGQVDEVAKPAVFLASEDASYVTGAVLSVDGGMVL